MVSAKQMSINQQQRLIHVNKPRLLIVSDSTERLNNLKAMLGSREIEITQVASIEELIRACNIRHHIAVVDVGPEQIVKVLKVLRGSQEHAATPLLVEASRISTAPDLVGVLPQYRAMPCCHNEMVALTRYQSTPALAERNAQGIL